MSEPDSPVDQDVLDAMAEELDDLGHRLSELSALLHARTGQRSEPSSESGPEPVRPPAPVVTGEPPAPPADQPVEPDDVEPGDEPEPRWAANRVLAWVGGAVTLLGVVFLLVLAAQRGWLSPPFRVVGGGLLGAVLVGAGHRVHRRPESRTAAYALAATGFAALYLDVVAVTALYQYLPVAGGLGAGLLIAAGGLLLADRWRAQILAVGVVAGCTVCAPLITQGPGADLVGFLLLLQVAATPVQLRHGWRVLTVVSSVPVVVAALVANVGALLLPEDRVAVVAAAGAVAFLGVLVGTATARLRPYEPSTAIVVVLISPVPALLAALLLERTIAGFLAAGVAALLLTLWLAARFTLLVPSRFVATAGGMATLAALQATMTFLDSSLWPSVLLCQALLLSLGAWRLRSGGPLLGALSYAVIGFLAALTGDLAPTLLLDTSGHGSTGVPGMLVGLLLAAVVVIIPGLAVRLDVLDAPPRAWAAWVPTGLVLLYATSATTMVLALLVREDRAGFLTGHVLITISWALAAIVLMLRGVRSKHLRVPGTALLGVALAKLFLFDLATLDGLARVVAFLCVGLVLLAAGVRYARLIAAAEDG